MALAGAQAGGEWKPSLQNQELPEQLQECVLWLVKDGIYQYATACP